MVLLSLMLLAAPLPRVDASLREVPSCGVTAVGFASPGHVWLADRCGGILESDDAGHSWQRRSAYDLGFHTDDRRNVGRFVWRGPLVERRTKLVSERERGHEPLSTREGERRPVAAPVALLDGSARRQVRNGLRMERRQRRSSRSRMATRWLGAVGHRHARFLYPRHERRPRARALASNHRRVRTHGGSPELHQRSSLVCYLEVVLRRRFREAFILRLQLLQLGLHAGRRSASRR